MNKDFIDNILGTNIKARHKGLNKSFDDQSFTNLIIHREIHGGKVYVPLDLNKIWNRIN